MTRHQYGISALCSFLRRHFAGKPEEALRNVGCFLSHVTALLTLKANWFDTLTLKQWEIMINNDVLLFSATNEDTPYEQLLCYWFSQASKDIKIIFNDRTYILVVA